MRFDDDDDDDDVTEEVPAVAAVAIDRHCCCVFLRLAPAIAVFFFFAAFASEDARGDFEGVQGGLGLRRSTVLPPLSLSPPRSVVLLDAWKKTIGVAYNALG